MSAKDELIKVLEDSNQLGCGCCADSREVSTGPEDWEVDYVPRVEALADDLIAAGYGKPRIVTTVKELEALPEQSYIREDDGFVNVKYRAGWLLCFPETSDLRTNGSMVLPATVLYEGEEA